MKTTNKPNKIVANHSVSNKLIIPMIFGVIAFVALATLEPKDSTDSNDVCQAAHISAGYSANDTNAYCSF